MLGSEGCEARSDFTAEGRPFASRGFGSFFCYLGERLGRILEAASLSSLGAGLMGLWSQVGLLGSAPLPARVPLYPKLGWPRGPRLGSDHANEMLILKARLTVASKCLGTLLTAREAPKPLWAA